MSAALSTIPSPFISKSSQVITESSATNDEGTIKQPQRRMPRPARRARRRTGGFSLDVASGRRCRVVRLLTDSETASTGCQRSGDGREELVGLLERGAVAVGDPPAPGGPRCRRDRGDCGERLVGPEGASAPHCHSLPPRRLRLGALLLDQISSRLGGAVDAERRAHEIDCEPGRHCPALGARTDTEAHGRLLSRLVESGREHRPAVYRASRQPGPQYAILLPAVASQADGYRHLKTER